MSSQLYTVPPQVCNNEPYIDTKALQTSTQPCRSAAIIQAIFCPYYMSCRSLSIVEDSLILDSDQTWCRSRHSDPLHLQRSQAYPDIAPVRDLISNLLSHCYLKAKPCCALHFPVLLCTALYHVHLPNHRASTIHLTACELRLGATDLRNSPSSGSSN
uniref:ARAD1B18073p n=1 Tax=Blastobotrys adeninivorans TaxID=409370 RepID=A0A060T6U8_BLAAD